MTRVVALSALVLTMVLVATATLAQKTIETGDFSGWMDNYEMLSFDEERNAFFFQNEVKQGVYKKVMFESLVFHGEGVVTNPKIAGQAASDLSYYLPLHEAGIDDFMALSREERIKAMGEYLKQLE